MFGKNPNRPPDWDDGNKLWIQEVFPTIQGEGPEAGTAAIFIRLAGCNLKCFYCDTDFESSTWHPTVDELLSDDLFHTGPPRLVVLTGGEPFRQDVGPLVRRLNKLHYSVQVETAGTLFNEEKYGDLFGQEPNQNSIVCSPKTPNIHPQIEHRIGWYKYIIRSGETCPTDGLPIMSTQDRDKPQDLYRPPSIFARRRIFVQPCDDYNIQRNMDNQNLCIQLCQQYGYRISIQLHKLFQLP